MRFKRANDIGRYIQKQIDTGNTAALKSFKDKNGAPLPVVSDEDLQEAADALRQYLHDRIKDYFDSYSPEVYERTGKFLDSLKVEPVTENGAQSYRVFFEESGAVRDSLWEDQPQAYLPQLLDSGYEVKSGWHKNIPHFGFFAGANFFQNAIDDARNDERFDKLKIIFNSGSPF